MATSGYQVEGGFNGDGEPHNNWAAWEGAGRAARSGLACDFWRHPEEALDRAAAIGCNAFRLSVEWARLEPQPGAFDAAALERYAEILSLCVERGLEPIVTLHHFTHPFWLGEEFWLRPGSPDVFARHVERVVPALAPYCRRWVTINEPNIVTLMGWIEGSCPPGRRMAVADAFCALDNILTAHVLAADVVTAVQPEAEVTVNTSSSSVYEHDRMLLDLLQLRDAGVDPDDVDRYVDERRTVHDAAFPPRHAGEAVIRRFFAAVSPYGAVRELGRGAAWSRLRGVTRRPAPRRVIAGGLRVVAAARAWTRSASTGTTRWPAMPCASPDGARPTAGGTGRSAGPTGTWSRTRPPCAPGASRSPRCAPGSRCGSWRTAWRRGRVDGRAVPREDGMDRPRYVREHLGAMVDAVAAGAPVTAYFHWSLMDNYEWGTYEPRYGIFGVDRSDPTAVHFMDTDAVGDDAAGAVRPGGGRPACRRPQRAGPAGLISRRRRSPARPTATPPAPRTPCPGGGGARGAPQ